MGEMIDFSMLRRSPRASLDPIIEALDGLAKSRNAQQQQERQIQFQREQLAQKREIEARLATGMESKRAADEAKQNLNERRFVGEQTMRNSRSREALNEQVRGDVANSDFGRAQQRADAYSEQDPATGEVKQGLPGFKVDRGTMPAPLESPVEYGPRATPEISEEAALIRAGQSAKPTDSDDGMGMGGGDVVGEFQRAENERKRFEGQNTVPKDLEMAMYQRQLDSYGRKQPDPAVPGQGMDADGNMGPAQIAPGSRERPDVTIAGVPTNPDDLRYSAGRAEGQDFQKLGNVLQTQFRDAVATGDKASISAVQRRMEAFAELAPQVESGRVPASKAFQQLMGTGTAENAREAAMEQTLVKGTQAQGRAETIATGQAQRSAATGQRMEATADRAEKSMDLKERQERSRNTKQDLDSFIQRWNAKTTQEAAQEFPNIVKMLDSGNGKLQDQALITMMRLAQKDNRFSDADAKLAMRSGAGWLDQMESFVSKGVVGNYGEDVISAARQAAERLQQFYNQKAGAMNEEADSFLDDDGLYDTKRAASRLGRELPGFRQRHPELYGKAARPAGGGGRRPDQNDPDDANAKDAGRPLDGDAAPDPANMTRDEKIEYLRSRGMLK